ncbi:mersacidin/lichenicidin family type 2 lantibiotic [Nostoc sp. CHAB 5784]|uniref:mersacidin/lichenicidin family type 2 lantibiotic n=1 Tax=Nostoc mirabile TaxID=2907820 RepID=UPI001E62D7EF|nr:mersacidin/lichenicidin family type 2 lantibiotic [Nostoc mirabile]MCC5669527.1 mersacidin/lichenicidin family type 2 lantibiotic [Nostoc mirabile CHAB5784]
MSQQDIIRAWKDRGYRESLSEEQRSQLPENPAGIAELSDEVLETIAGGRRPGGGGGTGAGTGGNCGKCTKVVSSECGYGTGAGTGGNCSKCAGC